MNTPQQAHLANWLSCAAGIPRSEARKAIAQGRVRVDGAVHTTPHVERRPGGRIVELDGRKVNQHI